MAGFRIKKLSDLLRGKSNGERLPSLVDLAIIEAVLELAGYSDASSGELKSLAVKADLDPGIAQSNFAAGVTTGTPGEADRRVDSVDYKVDTDPV